MKSSSLHYLFLSLVFLGVLQFILALRALYLMLFRPDHSYQLVGSGIELPVALILFVVAASVRRRAKL